MLLYIATNEIYTSKGVGLVGVIHTSILYP